MTRSVGATTRLFALLGNPVGQSLSPVMQNAALREAGLDAVYVALRCGSEDCAGLIRGLARAGGGGNVTVPHKALAARIVESPSARVRRTRACNTFWLDDGVICGENTDVDGFRSAARTLLGGTPAGARILLLGAGGGARAALAGLLEDGAGEVAIFNRTPERAAAMAAEAGSGTVRLLASLDDVQGESFDLVVNATSLGLRSGDPLPLSLEAPTAVGGVLDLVYAPGGTPLIQEARRLGVPAADGTEMLLRQGAAAYRIWWAREAPLAAMRAALEAAA